MSRARRSARRPTPPPDPFRRFCDEVSRFGHGRHQTWRVFSDFCELAAMSLANVVDRNQEREDAYLGIIKHYKPEEGRAMAALLAHVVAGLEAEPSDFLGRAFQALELANHWKGQFFTPFPIAQMMAALVYHDTQADADGIVTFNDPACGSGVMPIAVALAMRAGGREPQRFLHVTAQDVDRTAAHMCLIQLSLLGIPAQVVIGNSLTLEVDRVLHTPAHFLGFWPMRLARRGSVGWPSTAVEATAAGKAA